MTRHHIMKLPERDTLRMLDFYSLRNKMKAKIRKKMGSYKDRGRRPFIWQDEMAEVKNLFRKVAKVKSSGFTGFSVWKDEPTAETLSKNRLRRRRSQYALDLTHLNYSESPYQALNHLHNIRGMCCRIQRQDSYVERKKKDYDADIHPSLLRRPVTAFSYNGWDGGDRASIRRRPSSVPFHMGTPLHYTAPKPTVLYDATHRCPRYRGFPKRTSSSLCSSRSGRSVPSVRGATSDSSSTVHSTPVPSTLRTHSVSQSTSTTYRLNLEYGVKQGVPSSRTPWTTAKEVSTPDSDSSDVETGSQDLSRSVLSVDQRPPSQRSAAIAQERPPSRLVSRRKQQKQRQEIEHRKPDKRDDVFPTLSSMDTSNGCTSTQAGAPDSPSSTVAEDVFVSSNRGALSSRKEKLLSRSCGLWALKQQQQRPMTGDSSKRGRIEDQKQRPSTSPAQAPAHFSTQPNEIFSSSRPGHVMVGTSCSISAGNRNSRRRDDVPTVQRCVDHSDESCSETDHSVITDSEKLATSADAHSSGNNSCENHASPFSDANEVRNTALAAAGDDNHVLIKHSTDPYADFKTSMMHMINEEGLIGKQWELEELFQYYMDLNPVVHHDILTRVINDIRKDLASGKASR